MKFTQALAGLVSVVALLVGALVVTPGVAAAQDAGAAGCSVAGVSIATPLMQTDCDALVTFHAATDGSNWTNSAGWLTATDPCTWHGVMCSMTDDGHVGVTELNLSWNSVTGALPAEIGDLTDLHTLILQGNSLTGPIPSEIGNLAGLQFLALSGNPLGGSLPIELWTLTNLQMLVIEDAGLTGGLPASVLGLSELTVLVLSDNDLTGAIPAELALLELVYLDLSNNNLVGEVPVSLSDKVASGDVVIDGNDGLTVARSIRTDSSAAVSCLGPNGRIDVVVANPTDASVSYSVTIGTLSPRDLIVEGGEQGTVTATGRADGPLMVTVEVDGVEVFSDELVVACDPAVEVFVYVTCTDGNGRVDTTVTNLSGSDASYAVTVGALAPRLVDVADGDVRNVAATGRADGPLDISVTRNGEIISTSTHNVACD